MHQNQQRLQVRFLVPIEELSASPRGISQPMREGDKESTLKKLSREVLGQNILVLGVQTLLPNGRLIYLKAFRIHQLRLELEVFHSQSLYQSRILGSRRSLRK